MSEITQPPPDLQTSDGSTRVNSLGAASDQNTSNQQSAKKKSGNQAKEAEAEKHISHHDPAVTLASTLSKLDQGSNFTANVEGNDADGRKIIASDLGTYLVTADQKYTENLDKIKQDTQIELRVLTVGQEIKAEIIRPPAEGSESVRPIIIPVQLTLTDLAQNNVQQTPTTSNQQPPQNAPIEEIRSQYQATTLYKAERIARDIADKLENLPLPTSSPNYTIFGATSEGSLSSVAAPKQVSSNIFIQEVKTAPVKSTANIQTNVQQILGQNISVEVVKAVEQTPTSFPAGLPQSVINEITVATPIDTVKVGQNINISIAAIAVPDTDEIITVDNNPNTPVATTLNEQVPAAQNQRQNIQNKPASSDNQIPTIQSQNALVSGIIVEQPLKQSSTNQILQNQPTASQNKQNEYFLATPTSVLKFSSETPLVPGTIVSFTVADRTGNPIPADTKPNIMGRSEQVINTQTPQTNISNVASPVLETSENKPTPPLSTLPAGFSERIENFYPQPLEQLIENWGSISLAMSALLATASASAASALSSRIPNMQSPEQLTSTMFFFLSALKSPQPSRAWAGPDVSARLRQIGATKVFDKMDHDFARISQLNIEQPAGEWRPLLIPLQNGPEITAIPMLTKQITDEEKENSENKQNNDEDKIKETRFILEVKFSQLGLVTIDGMLRQNRLDIILKSAQKIPFAIKMKLSRHFSDALHNHNFEGELVIIDNAPENDSILKIIGPMMAKQKFEKKV